VPNSGRGGGLTVVAPDCDAISGVTWCSPNDWSSQFRRACVCVLNIAALGLDRNDIHTSEITRHLLGTYPKRDPVLSGGARNSGCIDSLPNDQNPLR
jgi:hypothetical protein